MRFLFSVIFVFSHYSCTGTISTVKNAEEMSMEDATVIDATGLDGCQFLIELQDGRRLQAIDIPDEFKKDGLKIRVDFKVKTGMMSICMAGPSIELLKIEKR